MYTFANNLPDKINNSCKVYNIELFTLISNHEQTCTESYYSQKLDELNNKYKFNRHNNKQLDLLIIDYILKANFKDLDPTRRYVVFDFYTIK